MSKFAKGGLIPNSDEPHRPFSLPGCDYIISPETARRIGLRHLAEINVVGKAAE